MDINDTPGVMHFLTGCEFVGESNANGSWAVQCKNEQELIRATKHTDCGHSLPAAT